MWQKQALSYSYSYFFRINYPHRSCKSIVKHGRRQCAYIGSELIRKCNFKCKNINIQTLNFTKKNFLEERWEFCTSGVLRATPRFTFKTTCIQKNNPRAEYQKSGRIQIRIRIRINPDLFRISHEHGESVVPQPVGTSWIFVGLTSSTRFLFSSL